MPVKLHTRETLNPNILLLDGISRSGKFFLGKIVSHCERVEYFDYCLPLEHVPIYWRFGCYTEGAAIPILKTLVDLHVYEKAIGRHLSTRADDDTAVFKAPDHARYARRGLVPRGKEALEEITKEHRYSTFLTHETLPNIELYLKAYPEMKVLNLQRHPVDLIHSWHRKELGKTYGSDPVVFRPLAAGKKEGIPWFAHDWADQYESMNQVDREISAVVHLRKLELESYARLSEKQKKQICFISYERLVTDPDSQVALIETFLQTKALPVMPGILRRERCGRPLNLGERKAKYDELAQTASPQCAEVMKQSSLEYEKQWQLPSFIEKADQKT